MACGCKTTSLRKKRRLVFRDLWVSSEKCSLHRRTFQICSSKKTSGGPTKNVRYIYLFYWDNVFFNIGFVGVGVAHALALALGRRWRFSPSRLTSGVPKDEPLSH